MEIPQPVEYKEVTDYEFCFNNGIRLPLAIDKEAGDSVEDTPETYIVTLSAKPSLSNPKDKLPAETATVYKAALTWVIVRTRQQRITSPEEQFDMAGLLMKISKTVQ